MEISISNTIRIKGASAELTDHLRQQLTIKNPEYTNKMRRGYWVGNTPEFIALYSEDGDEISIPSGVGYILKPYVSDTDVIKVDLATHKPLEYAGKVDLYDYQEEAVKACLRANRGILQSPCGSGKTQMGIALAAGKRGKTLWLTHTEELLEQSYERAAKYFPEETLGKISDGKMSIGSHITFAMVQTLSKIDLAQVKYCWDTVIVDECHRVSGAPTCNRMFFKILNSLAARYKYGLSATVHRSDGLIKTAFAVLGPIIYKVPDEAVADKTMQVTVKKVNTEKELDDTMLDTDGTILYSGMISSIVEDTERNELIGEALRVNKEHFNLILSDRIGHLQELMKYVDPDEAVIITGKMQGKKGKLQRAQAISDIKEGRKHYLFASYGLAKEGLDIPRLDRLYLATPKKDYAVVTQSVGRIARTFDGKEAPICYDFVDNQIPYCENCWKKRKTSYRKAGCKIWE